MSEFCNSYVIRDLGAPGKLGYAHSAGRFRFPLRFRELAPVGAIMPFVGEAIQTV